MRFIHMADVHLGAVPDSGCPWSAFRENEIWETFVRVIDQIREEKIELLLIAGDLFHRQPLPSQIERVSQLFASIPDTEVVWMAGSHDYLREDSAYRKAKWTKNVHGFLSGKPEVIELEKLHTKVYGCSYEQPQITEPVYSTIRPDDQPGIHILLAYGGDETHIPMKKEDGAGFTYVALGYRHLPGVLVENQMAYAGSPEPIRLEDAGTHGVVYGEITEDAQGAYHTQITLVPSACRSYIPLSLRIHSGTTQTGLEQKVQDAIQQKGSGEIYWLRIQGYRNPELEFQLEPLKAYGNVVRITDETRPCYDLTRLKREKLGTPVGAYIHWFEKKQGKVEQKALDYGLQALLTETMDPDQVIEERMNDWEERKKTLEKQRQDRSTELEQTVQRVVRERAGLEQQMLVNRSEIRRLELNRNAQEKHLEQERREEGKRQAEESRRPQSGQEQENEPTVVEKRVQNVAASSERKSNLTDFSKISKISENYYLGRRLSGDPGTDRSIFLEPGGLHDCRTRDPGGSAGWKKISGRLASDKKKYGNAGSSPQRSGNVRERICRGRASERLGRAVEREKERTAGDQSSDPAAAGAWSTSGGGTRGKEDPDRKSSGGNPGDGFSDTGGRRL